MDQKPNKKFEKLAVASKDGVIDLKSPTPRVDSHPSKNLSPADLLRHADAIIRFDREASLKSVGGLDDLVAPSNDANLLNGESSEEDIKPKKLTSLEALTGSRGLVKFSNRVNEVETSTPKNIVEFLPRKKDS